jgi:hypothetical protein
MTIQTYLLTFGFYIKKSDVLRLLHYDVAHLTDEIRQDILDEYGEEGEDYDNIYEQWFERDYNESGVVEFTIGEVTYVVRTIKHDQQDHDDCYVVGMGMGAIDRFTFASIQTRSDALTSILPLVRDTGWFKAIQSAGRINTMSYKPKDYGVQDVEYPECMWWVPSVVITTDDCDCCS